MSVELLTEHHLEVLSLKGDWVYTCQNATLLEITCRCSFIIMNINPTHSDHFRDSYGFLNYNLGLHIYSRGHIYIFFARATIILSSITCTSGSRALILWILKLFKNIWPWPTVESRWIPCADQECFVRGGPTLTTFFLVDTTKIEYSLIAGVPSSWWPNIECWLGSLVIFQGIQTSVAKKPYIFVIFQGSWGGGGGVRTPCSLLDPPMTYINTIDHILVAGALVSRTQ